MWDSDLFAYRKTTIVRAEIFFGNFCPPGHYTSDQDCISPTDQRPSGVLQLIDLGASLTLCCRTSDRLGAVCTASDIVYSAQVHRSTSTTSFCLVLSPQLPGPATLNPDTATPEDMTEPIEPISFQKRLLRQLDVLRKQTEATYDCPDPLQLQIRQNCLMQAAIKLWTICPC